jgi:hypothetical protein
MSADDRAESVLLVGEDLGEGQLGGDATSSAHSSMSAVPRRGHRRRGIAAAQPDVSDVGLGEM